WNTTAGLAHVWEVYRDLIFRTQLEAARTLQPSSVVNQSGVAYTKPIKYTSLFASTSIEKSFGRFFTPIAATINANSYSDTTNRRGQVVNESFQDGARTTVNGRLGYHISPIVYAFVEPSVNSGRFNASSLNSDGYQVVAGLGTGRIRNFNGELY